VDNNVLWITMFCGIT